MQLAITSMHAAMAPPTGPAAQQEAHAALASVHLGCLAELETRLSAAGAGGEVMLTGWPAVRPLTLCCC